MTFNDGFSIFVLTYNRSIMRTQPFRWKQAIQASSSLDSVERVNEILFGLIMVLTFTCSISAATHGQEELKTILWSALGCNVAWGFVDAFMYLFSVLLERGETFQEVRDIRKAASSDEANEVVKGALPPFLSGILLEEHISYLSNTIRDLPDPPAKASLAGHDLLQGVKIFLLVFLSTFPVTLPFLLIAKVSLAIRISNAIAVILLFCIGVYLGRQTSRNQFLTGLMFAFIGLMMVAVTMALGG